MSNDLCVHKRNHGDDIISFNPEDHARRFPDVGSFSPRNPMVVPDQREKFTYADNNRIRVIDHIIKLTDLRPGWFRGNEVPPNRLTSAVAVYTLRLIPDKFYVSAMPGDNGEVILAAMLNDFCVELIVLIDTITSIGIEKGIGNIYDDLLYIEGPTDEQVTAAFALVASTVAPSKYDKERTIENIKQIFPDKES